MAFFASHVGMAPGQGKLRAFIMIECRRRPSLIDVAIRAFGDSILGRKLVSVGIGMASFAIFRRAFKLNFVRSGKRLVAFAAGHHAMSAGQRKFCFGMVKSADVDPGPRAVASFAALRSAICFFRRHAVFKFTLVRIGVARRARTVRKVERQNFVCSSTKACFVAFGASHGDVRACQREMRFLVFGNRECGAVKILYRVAIFAAVQVGRGGKLVVVLILVAIRARRKLHFILRILARGSVALVAGHGRMLAVERIF